MTVVTCTVVTSKDKTGQGQSSLFNICFLFLKQKSIYYNHWSMELVNIKIKYNVPFANCFCCTGLTDVSLHFNHLLVSLSLLHDQ